MIRNMLALLAMAALPTLAQAVEVRPPDEARLRAFDAAFGHAMKQALMGGAPEDVAILTEALRGEPGPLAPAGEWNCRTMKLGNLSPLVVYTDFRCRITEEAPGTWRIEKLTGSQRLSGTIGAGEGDALYVGVGYVSGGPATDYAGLPPEDQEAVQPGQTIAQVGFFEQMGPDRARLLLPSPLLESDFDILYLTR